MCAKNKNTLSNVSFIWWSWVVDFSEGLVWLKKIETAENRAARIAIRAVIDADFYWRWNVSIGLNCSDLHLGAIYLWMGKPILVSDFIDPSIVGDKDLEIEAARRLPKPLKLNYDRVFCI